MAHPHHDLITRFYEAFSRRDAEGMAACYHPGVRFSDPVFPDLEGPAAGDMWRMLCALGVDLTIEFSEIQADESSGSAHWDARYTFSATGRKVLNRIDARFTFKDGLIHSHTDQFDLWAWTRQALGPMGVLLGWTPMVQNKVRSGAAANLEKWRAKNGRTQA